MGWVVMGAYKAGETLFDDISGLKVKIPGITRTQMDDLEAANIRKAVLTYQTRRRNIDFNCAFFKKLHAEMFCNVWRWAGMFRTTQTNLGSMPQMILQDLILLEQDLKSWPETLESAARLHHRAVQIHPFPNGNGRWARLLADLWLWQNTGAVMHWPVSMQKENDIRAAYIASLKAADGLDYDPLIKIYKSYCS